MEISSMIAAEAERWVGTPFIWHGRVRGRGCDCKGLVAGVARACGRPEAESIEALAGDYGRIIDPQRLRAGLMRLLDRVTEPLPGDVLLMRVGGKLQHLAIVGVSGRHIVHCYSGGPDQVVRVAYGSAHRAATDSAWRWRPA